MYRVLDILTPEEVAECREIAAGAAFVHGKISNPHNKAKQNEQLHEQAAYQRSAKLVLDALLGSEEFREFAFPAQIAPPLLTRYRPGMHYGAHADAAYLTLAQGTVRSSSTSLRIMKAERCISASPMRAFASSSSRARRSSIRPTRCTRSSR